MKIATGLTLVAVGAILAFAVRTSPPGVNIHTVGWVIMLTGAAGILLRGRASGWLRRRVTVRRSLAEPADDGTDAAGDIDGSSRPPYVLHDPAALASAILQDAGLAGAAEDDPQTAPTTPGLAAVNPGDDEAAGPSGTLDDLLEGRTDQGPRR